MAAARRRGGLGAAAAPRQPTTRPGHNTPMLVLYGSNLGTAEELATRIADLAEVNGFADAARAARRLRRQAAAGGRRADHLRLLQRRAARQRDAIRQMARRRSAEGCLRQRALRRVRLRQQRLGRDLPVGAAPHRRAACRSMARARSIRAARAMRASDLDGQFQNWFPAAAQVATKEFGIDWNFTRTAEDDPLYAIEPVGGDRRQPHRRAGRRCRDEGAGQSTSCRTSPAPIRPSARRGISRCSCRPTSPIASAII